MMTTPHSHNRVAILRAHFARSTPHLVIRSSLGALAMAFVSAVPASAEPAKPLTKWVMAEGLGASNDKAKARDDAITDAQRRALEHGVGLYVKADTLVANAELVNSHIYTKSEGFVVDYEVLNEKHEADGVCRVTLRAKLFLGKLKDALGGLCTELKLRGNPRVVIAIDVPEGVDDTARDAVTARVRRRLVEQRITVLDVGQLAGAKQSLVRRLQREGDRPLPGAVELAEDADLVIKGTVTTRALGNVATGLDGILTGEATLDLWAAWTDTGRVVVAERCQAKAPAYRQEQATGRALVKAAEEWVGRALCRLKLVCADPITTYDLTVTGLKDARAAEKLTETLAELRFVRTVRGQSFARGTAYVEVEYLGPIRNLCNALAELLSPKLEVTSSTGRTLSVKCAG